MTAALQLRMHASTSKVKDDLAGNGMSHGYLGYACSNEVAAALRVGHGIESWPSVGKVYRLQRTSRRCQLLRPYSGAWNSYLLIGSG